MPPTQIPESNGQRESQQNQNELSRTAAALFLFVPVILQQVIEVRRTGSGVRINAQTAASSRSGTRLVESQKRRPADGGRILRQRRCGSRSRSLRADALRRHRRRGSRYRCAKRGGAVRRAFSRHRGDGNSFREQLRAAHAAEAVRIRILIAATSAAQPVPPDFNL